MEEQGRAVYTIALAAQQVGLSARTLRIYEQEGLIRPARKAGREQRLYSEQDLTWIRCISLLAGEALPPGGGCPLRALLEHPGHGGARAGPRGLS